LPTRCSQIRSAPSGSHPRATRPRS
jgi:hypothetical protein